MAKVRAALAACSVLLLAGEAQATTTRVFNLGVMNRFVLDDANRWLWPHTITRYGNLFYLELFGSEPSLAFTAPDSQRGADTYNPDSGNEPHRDAISMTPSERFGMGMLTSAELAGVQSAAGGGFILRVWDELYLSAHLSDYENPVVKSFLEGPLGRVSSNDPNGAPGAPAFPWLTSGLKPRTVSDANRKLDLMFAYNVPDLLAVGLQFTYGSSKYHYLPSPSDDPITVNDNTNVTREIDDIGSSELGIKLSAGLELSDALAFDAGLGLTFHSLTYLPNSRSDLIDGGGGLEFQLDARSMIGLTDWWELVPAVTIRTVGFSATDLADFANPLNTFTDDAFPGGSRFQTHQTDVSSSLFLFDLGVAGHFKPVDVVDFWVAAGYQFMSTTTEFTNPIPESPNATPQPINRCSAGDSGECQFEAGLDMVRSDATPYFKVGLEAQVFSWLDLRAGVVKYLKANLVRKQRTDDQDSEQDIDYDYVQDQPFFDYFVGAAAHYHGFFLDLQLDPSWFKRGPFFLSGSGAPMFVNASLGYRY